MRRLLVDSQNPDPRHLAEAAALLRQGGLLALPTDTVYGLTCDPGNGEALRALYRLKGRSADFRLPFIAADLAQAARLASLEGALAGRLAKRFWPGPLTLVLPLIGRNLLAPGIWGDTVALRVPALPLARALAASANCPLPATSANRSGEPPASDPEQMDAALRSGLDLLLDAGRLAGDLPSTILDLTTSEPRLLRPGAVPLEELAAVLGALPSPGR